MVLGSAINVGAQPLKKVFKKPAASLEIKPQEYFNIGGTVFAEETPIQVFDATLYYRYTNMYLFIEKEHFDTLGYFFFMNLPEGFYAVKAEPIPGSIESRKYLPTYTGNALHWQDAALPYLNSSFYTADIHLLEAAPEMLGPACINGQLVRNDKEGSGKQEPVRNAEILLQNPQGFPITYINTDMNGFFTFPQLIWGSYQVFPEVPGLNTIPMMVNLNPDHPNAFVQFVMDDHQIAAGGIKTGESLDHIISAPYPMPARDELMLDYSLAGSGTAMLYITDLAGRRLIGPQAAELQGKGTVHLDLKNITSGTYLLGVEMEGQRSYLQKVVVIR